MISQHCASHKATINACDEKIVKLINHQWHLNTICLLCVSLANAFETINHIEWNQSEILRARNKSWKCKSNQLII